MMEKNQKIMSYALVGILTWIILMIFLSLFADGQLYSIDQPVEVVRTSSNEVILHFERHSFLSMYGICSRELVCSGLVLPYKATDCPIGKGRASFDYRYDIPVAAQGVCYYVGVVVYEPLGIIGPRLAYEWVSEEFELP